VKFRFTISRKLTLGFSVFAAVVIFAFYLTGITLSESREINRRINTIYAPSVKLLEELDNQLVNAQQLMKQWAYVQRRDDDQERIEAMTLCTQKIPNQLNRIDTLSAYWSAEQRAAKNRLVYQVNALLAAYEDVRGLLPTYNSYFDPILQMSAEVYFIEGDSLSNALSHARLELHETTTEQRSIMTAEIERMNDSFGRLSERLIYFAIFVFLVGFIIAVLTSQAIVRPVNSLRTKLTNLARGIYSIHATRAYNDEIGDMAQAVEKLITSFERTKEFSLSVGAGNFDMQYEPLSEHDELGKALLRMRDDLASYRNEMEEKVAHQTSEIREQKERVTELYSDLQASIDYAQRLQATILPSAEAIREVFPQHFVFYRPKATVSGDFYWFANKGKKRMVAAADCTGHGVPGAFMSLVGHNALNQATKVYNKPSQVLNTVNRLSAQALRAEENHLVKDGMDIALCSIDMESLEMEFSGAQNPAYIVRNTELIELDGDAFSIGSYVNGEREFSPKNFTLQSGDCIYLFSDGYADQFGGPNGKKFMRKQFRQLLIDIYGLPMDEQKNQLSARFDAWRGDGEQIDDVLVIGIRV
jgi:serine phosphatase RsbU (regulator of sigma subunit)/HAMP domain-containing protein